MPVFPVEKKSKAKVFIRFFSLLLCVLLLVIACLPTLISSSWGREKLVAWINQSIPGKIEVKEIAVSWFGPQSLNDLTLYDQENHSIMSLGRLSSGNSLFHLIFTRSTDSAEFHSLNLQLISDQKGHTNLLKALDKKCCESKMEMDEVPFTLSLKKMQGKVDLVSSENYFLETSGETEQGGVEGKFSFAAEISRVYLQEMIHHRNLAEFLQIPSEDKLNIQAHLTNFPVELLDRIASLKYPKFSGLIHEALGEQLNLEIHQTKNENGISFSLKSDRLEVPPLTFQIDRNLTLQKPAQIIYKINQEFFNQIFRGSNALLEAPAAIQLMIKSFSLPVSYLTSPMDALYQLRLEAQLNITSLRFANYSALQGSSVNDFFAKITAHPNSHPTLSASFNIQPYLFKHELPLEFTIDSSPMPLNSRDLSHLKLNGKLKLHEFLLMHKSDGRSLATIDHFTADWSLDAAAKLVTIDFQGITKLGENQAAGKINGTVTLSEWIRNGAIDLTQAFIRMKAMANKMPVELISALTGHNDLVTLIGNSLDLSIEGTAPLIAASSAEKGSLSLDLKSENFSGSLGLTLGDSIRLNSEHPAEFTLKLTPHGYAALRKKNNLKKEADFILLNNAEATLRLRSLDIPLFQSFSQSSIQGEFSIKDLNGRDIQTKNSFSLESIQGQIFSENLAEKVDFNMVANGTADQGVPIAWEANGSLLKGFSKEGILNKNELSLAFDAATNSFPISLVCQFICLDPKLKQKFEVLLGDKVDAKIKAELRRMNGILHADVRGKNSWFAINATVREGNLTLNEDLKAQLVITPLLSDYVLDDFLPFLNGMLSADHPVNLTIAKEGFSLPLNNPDVQTIRIGKAVLDSGKVRFSSQSQISKVLSLLAPTSSDLLVWLTPVHFSLNDGILQLQRADMLINDNYPIAVWGTVNFPKDRVNLIVGLAGAAITKAFSVPGISNAYFLQLPLKGRLKSPSIDKAKAMARLSALVAHSQGGPQGLVLGTVLDIATGGLTEDAVPPPTTNPLPWSELMKEETKKGEVKNPIEEMGKGASSLLQKLFK